LKLSIICAVAIFECCSLLGERSCLAETYTSITKTSPIYKMQGEYLGVIDSWNGTWGAQVIATSEKSLVIHLLQGGLPGQGFSERIPTKKLSATIGTSSGFVVATNDSMKVMLNPDALIVEDSAGKKLGVLTKIVRESSTLGAKAPANATVLFEVGGPNNFENGKTDDEGLLGVGCTSAERFGDHRLHVEFRTPFQPDDSGQKRGNSGVYVQGRYEVQVLDSFGLEGEDNECGGIYKHARPVVNMCYPPLTWQTYDIDFTAAKYDESGKKTSNARITIKHNGVTIHQDQELTSGTPGKDKEGNSNGPLFLQNHNNPVVYRNIWAIRK
jgi:hypothetical protein